MLMVAKTIEQRGWIKLNDAFRTAFPTVSYTANYARRRFLQMPLVCIRISNRPGAEDCYLLEHVQGVNYNHFFQLFCQIAPQHSSKLSKFELQSLLSLCTSDRERACLRYAVYKASGLTATQARKKYGFQNAHALSKSVEDALENCTMLRKSVEKLAKIQEKSLLQSLGVPVDSSSEESDDDVELSESAPMESLRDCVREKPNLLEIVRKSDFNWFEISEELMTGNDNDNIESWQKEIEKLDLTTRERNLLNLSYEAFLISNDNENHKQRTADALNNYIVSESDEEASPEDIQKATSPIDPRLHSLIRKRRLSIKRKSKRLIMKRIAEANCLSRKKSKKVKGVIARFPDIGEKIENFVRSRNVGADQWRRTGLLTFDGNVKVNQKVTYASIQRHLQEEYGHHFGYGTVVQLCVARNKRRKSALRYKGVAQVTTRRARRGFALRFNPDKHWSSALYRGLNYVQYADGKEILNINRDDAAAFRLDTMTTNKHYATPTVVGENVLTTYTDYMNKYPSQLQVTSYNFSKTNTTREFCAGVVKATFSFPKNPAQHTADLSMLEETEELKSAFVDQSGEPKMIECVRVDGAGDENPSHEEVQFWWTLRHLNKKSLATLVTTRSSGSSYLNRVELQNGCLTRGHSNLFIPSTLGGDPLETTVLNHEVLERSMQLATEVYINYVNKSPCGDTVIHLFKGADSSNQQRMRDQLKIFLKGSKVKKQKLEAEESELYALFVNVWEVRKRHIMPKLPAQYMFYLLCCFEDGCIHPRCKQSTGMDRGKFSWFPNGPPLTFIPLPVPDEDRKWGSKDCPDCSEFCSGHYLLPEKLLTNSQPSILPPSLQIQDAFNSNPELSDTDIKHLAQKTLLSDSEVKIWVDHIKKVQRNRREGALKAAATRRKSQSVQRHQVYKCGVCKVVYEEETKESEAWIGCDECDTWFHFTCVGITVEPDTYTCSKCASVL